MEPLHDIPNQWAWTVLEDIGEISSGGTPRTGEEDNFDGDIAWITPADLTSYKSQYIARGRRNISDKGLRTSSAKLVPKGTVLFSSRAPIGYVVIASNPLCTNQGFKNLTPATQVFSEYIYYYLKGSKHLAESLASGTTFLELSGSRFAKIPIPLAPLNEQQRIVSKIEELFSRLDDGEVALRRVKRLLTSYRQAVLKAAVTGELTKEWREATQHRLESGADLLQRILVKRKAKWEASNLGKKYQLPIPPDTVNAPAIPTSWCWARVKHVGVVQLGRQRAPQYHNGPNMRPYLRVANVYEDRIETGNILEMNFDPAEYERYKLEYGDILLNEGQSPEYLGRPAMYRNEVPGSCFQNTLIRFKAVDGLLPEYALCVFRHYMHSGRFRKLSQITTNIAHLSVGRFVEIEFPLPPMNEQIQIVEEIERRLSSISHLVAETKIGLARTASLRQSILKAAFSGQLVPQDPSDEPASALLQRIQSARQSPAAKPVVRSLSKELGKRTPKQPSLWEPT